jgi:hypothetical protein
MEPVWVWLKGSVFAHFITNSPWVWPACETLHFMGMALLIGVVGAVDLRMLGFMKGVSFEPLHRLLPWGIAGFVINLLTGFLFFAGDPYQYKDNIAFLFKVLFIVLAGINVLVFYLVPFRQVENMGPGDDAPLSAKVIAATSIVLWMGVVYWGRMLPFIGNAF